jgi:phosphatidate cytidylyltransferase
MLLTRLITAIILAPLFLLLVRVGSPYFDILVGAIVLVMALEFTRMDGKEGGKRRLLIVAASVIAVASVFILDGVGPALMIVVVATVAVIAADQIAGRSGLSWVQAAIIYAALPAIALLFVHRVGGYESVFWLLAVVWMTDIGAYAFGRLIGGPKLAPSISPNKTWSGSVGGFISGIVAGAAVLYFFGRPPAVETMLLAAAVSVCTQIGDLFESALKRRYQVKDSGGIIPGHGGVMDRFDGLWAAAPAAALMCLAFGGGVLSW